MNLSLIAAIGNNNELGKDNALLWNLPKDMKFFRDTTRGHTVIMGRKTFESIGKPLPNRKNIVVTRDTTYEPEGVLIAQSFEQALELVKEEPGEVFVIGGAMLYKEAISRATKLYITHIDGTFEADTFFPTIDPSWKKETEELYPADDENVFSMRFVTYVKQ